MDEDIVNQISLTISELHEKDSTVRGLVALGVLVLVLHVLLNRLLPHFLELLPRLL